MQPKGQQLIGQETFSATGAPIQAVNPATGEHLEPIYARPFWTLSPTRLKRSATN